MSAGGRASLAERPLLRDVLKMPVSVFRYGC